MPSLSLSINIICNQYCQNFIFYSFLRALSVFIPIISWNLILQYAFSRALLNDECVKKKKSFHCYSWLGKGQDLFLPALFTHKLGFQTKKISFMASNSLRQNCWGRTPNSQMLWILCPVHAPGWCPTQEILHQQHSSLTICVFKASISTIWGNGCPIQLCFFSSFLFTEIHPLP